MAQRSRRAGCPLDEDHEITIDAEGYAAQVLTAHASSTPAEGCCACGYDVSMHDVWLVPELDDTGS